MVETACPGVTHTCADLCSTHDSENTSTVGCTAMDRTTTTTPTYGRPISRSDPTEFRTSGDLCHLSVCVFEIPVSIKLRRDRLELMRHREIHLKPDIVVSQ